MALFQMGCSYKALHNVLETQQAQKKIEMRREKKKKNKTPTHLCHLHSNSNPQEACKRLTVASGCCNIWPSVRSQSYTHCYLQEGVGVSMWSSCLSVSRITLKTTFHRKRNPTFSGRFVYHLPALAEGWAIQRILLMSCHPCYCRTAVVNTLYQSYQWITGTFSMMQQCVIDWIFSVINKWFTLSVG